MNENINDLLAYYNGMMVNKDENVPDSTVEVNDKGIFVSPSFFERLKETFDEAIKERKTWRIRPPHPSLTLSATTYSHPSGALVIEYPGNPLLTVILGDRKAPTLIEGLESVIQAMQLAEIVPDDIPTLGADGVLRDSKGNPVND